MWKKFSDLLHEPRPVEFQPFIADINGLHLQVIRSDKSDILALLEMERQIYKGKLPWRQRDFQNELARRDSLYLSLYDKSWLAAFIGMRITPKEAHITNISVLPDYQKRGIGTYLLGLMLAQAKSAGCRAVSLEVLADNKVARRLYERFGFKTALVRPGSYDENHDGLEMVLNLKADRKKKLF